MARWGPGPLSIRVRLGVAMAIALLPVLLLGAAQSVIAFNKEGQERRASLVAAADSSVATAQARLESARVILQTVSADTIGVNCAPRLRELTARTPGVSNMVRLDRIGRVQCAADSFTGQVAAAPWFQRLQRGEDTVIESAPPHGYTPVPSLLVATRAEDGFGDFDGALAALVSLQSLRPPISRSAPEDTQIAMLDAAGRLLTQTDPSAFAGPPADWRRQVAATGAYVYYGKDQAGDSRVFTVTPLLRNELFALLSAPSPGPFSWARLNLLSSVLFPLIAFLATLAAVWVAADQVIVRWLHYVERIAAIYAKGRLTVRPLQAERAPPEIKELADTLEAMAATIVARDASLHESLAQKDALLREIHHRVKNNLQVITSLLSLQQRSLSDPSAREAISDTRQRISAMALIYRALYQGPDLRSVELRAFLEELIAQLLVSDQDATGAIRTELHADDLVIHPDKLAPLALFAVEAISNAQKHAFAGRGGTLRVTFKVMGEEALFEIADDGPGQDAPRPAAGVGRTLMTAFARQLHGRVETEPNDWGGMTARLIFPIPDSMTPTPAGESAQGKRNRAAA